MMSRSVLLLAGLLLSGCATTTARPDGTVSEFQRVSAECRDRGGILTPIPGAATGRVETDYACTISGNVRRR
jgi:hypothetical protein